jgi:4-hydroxybenzoyl-CoA thioesterase
VIVSERPVKFEEVDAAQIVFFGHFVAYAHEAMEQLFAVLDGGYPRLILERRVGLPAVRVEMSFKAPARYGDALRIETSVGHLGNRSARLHYRMARKSDGVLVAEIAHTIVTTNLDTLSSCDMPADVRDALERHLDPPV